MSQLLYTVRPTFSTTAHQLIQRNATTAGTEWNTVIIHNTSDIDVNIGVSDVTNSTGFTLEPDAELHLTEIEGSDDVFEIHGISTEAVTIQVLLCRR